MWRPLVTLLGAVVLLMPAAGAGAASPSPSPVASPAASPQSKPPAPTSAPAPAVSPSPAAATSTPVVAGVAATVAAQVAAGGATAPTSPSPPPVVARWTQTALAREQVAAPTATPAPPSATQAPSTGSSVPVDRPAAEPAAAVAAVVDASPSATDAVTATPVEQIAVEAGTIQGTVSIAPPQDGEAPASLPKMQVVLTFPQGFRMAQSTGDDGGFQFQHLPPGQYRVMLGAPRGFDVQPARDVVVSLGGSNGVAVTFALTAFPLPPDAEAALSGPEDATTAIWTPVDPYQPDHLAALKRAGEQSSCGVPWQVLAAIAKVESDFGRNMSTSSAGAIGYGQFLPSTWVATVSDGDPYDYHAVLPAMARYLCRAGAAGDLRAALFAYNHADWYVDLVLTVATRFDDVAPGDPTRAVIDTPLQLGDSLHPPYLRYAPGRDAQHPAATGSTFGDVFWMKVPFPPAGSVVPRAGGFFQTSAERALAMLRGALQARAPTAGQTAASVPDVSSLDQLAVAAQASGLTPVDLRLGDGSYRNWTEDDLTWHLREGHPVVVPVATHLLPGHAGAAEDTAQVVVLTGLAGSDFVYNDPDFASTIGYDLLITRDELAQAWAVASPDHQAFAALRLATDATVAPTLLVAEAAETTGLHVPTVMATPQPTLPPLVPADRLDRLGLAIALPTVALAPTQETEPVVEAAAPPQAVEVPVPPAPPALPLHRFPVELCLWVASFGWLGWRRLVPVRRALLALPGALRLRLGAS